MFFKLRNIFYASYILLDSNNKYYNNVLIRGIL